MYKGQYLFPLFRKGQFRIGIILKFFFKNFGIGRREIHKVADFRTKMLLSPPPSPRALIGTVGKRNLQRWNFEQERMENTGEDHFNSDRFICQVNPFKRCKKDLTYLVQWKKKMQRMLLCRRQAKFYVI